MSKKKRKAHVLSWQSSGLSKAEYCRRENLVYVTFCSWCRSFKSGQGEFILLSSSDHVNVQTKRVVAMLPNGIELSFPDGIDRRSLKELIDV